VAAVLTREDMKKTFLPANFWARGVEVSGNSEGRRGSDSGSIRSGELTYVGAGSARRRGVGREDAKLCQGSTFLA
jgi:hypothetical protein